MKAKVYSVHEGHNVALHTDECTGLDVRKFFLKASDPLHFPLGVKAWEQEIFHFPVSAIRKITVQA